MTEAKPPLAVECVIPILRVTNLEVSLAFYQNLGFGVDWRTPDSAMASVSRDGHCLMLCCGAQGQPGTWVWIGVGDIVPLYEQATAQGLAVDLPPTNFYWAYEFRLEDPDGHILRFGSEPRDDLPFA